MRRFFIFNKPPLWSNYLVLTGLVFQLASPASPLAWAEDHSPVFYSSAVASENIGVSQAAPPPEDGLILADNIFIQSLSFVCVNGVCGENENTSANKILVTVTAYSSTRCQTDSTPFITASGRRVRDGVVACNFLPFGTKFKIPEIYGDKVFVVEDRMAAWNSHKIDIWMPSRGLALQFGIKFLQIEILE